MPLLIDTYNVLHTVGVLPPEIAGLDVAGLATLIRGSRFRHERTTLVCDGTAPAGEPGLRLAGVTVRYSGRGRTADEVIVTMIGSSSTPRRLTVVSSDRAVARAARRRRCPTMTSEAFLRQVAEDHHRPPGTGPRAPAPPRSELGEGAVAAWLETFRIAPDDPVFAPPALDPRLTGDPSPVAPAAGPVEDDPPAAADDGDAPPPGRPRRPPILPGDVLAEAADLVAADGARRDAEAAARAEAAKEDAGEPPGGPNPGPDEQGAKERKAGPDTPPPPRPLLPGDVLAEAEALLAGDAPAAPPDSPDRPSTSGMPGPAPNFPAPTPPARTPPASATSDDAPGGSPPGSKRPVLDPRHVSLPAELLAEAERLWDAAHPPDDEAAGGTSKPEGER